jgi:hypothetical protein
MIGEHYKQTKVGITRFLGFAYHQSFLRTRFGNWVYFRPQLRGVRNTHCVGSDR